VQIPFSFLFSSFRRFPPSSPSRSAISLVRLVLFVGEWLPTTPLPVHSTGFDVVSSLFSCASIPVVSSPSRSGNRRPFHSRESCRLPAVIPALQQLFIQLDLRLPPLITPFPPLSRFSRFTTSQEERQVNTARSNNTYHSLPLPSAHRALPLLPMPTYNLRALIKSIRATKTIADERNLIFQESAAIRTAFKEEGEPDLSSKRRVVEHSASTSLGGSWDQQKGNRTSVEAAREWQEALVGAERAADAIRGGRLHLEGVCGTPARRGSNRGRAGTASRARTVPLNTPTQR
jgi:hypothetical protein